MIKYKLNTNVPSITKVTAYIHNKGDLFGEYYSVKGTGRFTRDYATRSFFDTWEDAHNALVKFAERRIESTLDMLKRHKVYLNEAMGLQNDQI